VNDSEIIEFEKTINDKLANFKPSMMVYGVYNAGKSSVINALYGEPEKAKTGDTPETREIHEYEWNGFKLYDTPGIDAPIQLEEVTKEHLKKTEIILFVLGSDSSFEEEYIYERISEQVINEKPILIILNDKSAHGQDSKEIYGAITNISAHLITIGDKRGIKEIEKKVQMVYVNANTALKAKFENKDSLLPKSNIIQVEEEINRLLLSSDAGTVITNLNRYIVDFINDHLGVLAQKGEIKELEEMISKLENDQQKNRFELLLQIEQEGQLLVSEIPNWILNGMDQEELNKNTKKRSIILATKIEDGLNSIVENLEKELDTSNITMKQTDLKISRVDAIYDDEENIPKSTEAIEKMKDAIKQRLQDKELIEKVVKDTVIKVQLKLRDLGVEGFKGKWTKTIEKTGETAGKGAGKWLGSAIIVATTVWDIRQAYEEDEKQKQKLREQMQNAR
jgi:predicted GTPase